MFILPRGWILINYIEDHFVAKNANKENKADKDRQSKLFHHLKFEFLIFQSEIAKSSEQRGRKPDKKEDDSENFRTCEHHF